MDANNLFGMALGLGSGWKVVKSEMDVEGRRLRVWLDFEAGSRFACPECGQWCPVHDTVEKQWRHLNFWQHETVLIARVPRTKCDKDGVLLSEVPWARKGSGFTLMMEAMVLLLCQQMSVKAAATMQRGYTWETRQWWIGTGDSLLWIGQVISHGTPRFEKMHFILGTPVLTRISNQAVQVTEVENAEGIKADTQGVGVSVSSRKYLKFGDVFVAGTAPLEFARPSKEAFHTFPLPGGCLWRDCTSSNELRLHLSETPRECGGPRKLFLCG